MKKLLFLFLALLTASITFAQSAELVGVRRREFRGVYPILNKATRETKGYYCFYVNEKEEKGMVNFIIAIFDKDFKMVKQTPISITKRSKVDGGEYNGSDFLFLFNDPVKKTITKVTIDEDGNIIKTLGTIEEKMVEATADVYPAGDAGFFIVKPIKTPKLGYSIEMVDRLLNSKWEKRFTVDKGYVYPEALQVGNGRIAVIQVTGPSVLSQKLHGEILCLDQATGNDIFTYPLYDGTTTAVPSSLIIDETNNIVASGMYFNGERWDNTNSDGIFFSKIDPTGKVLLDRREDWDNGIQKYIKDASKKTLTISSKPKVFFHTIVQGADGGYQVIGETFKKNLSLINSSLADAVSGRYIGDMYAQVDNNKPVTFEVMDFIIFNFDNKGQMTNVNIIEKEHTKVSCYYPYQGVGGLALAKAVARYGFFNYAFMMTLPGSNQEFLVSANFSKNPYIGFNTIVAGEESKFNSIPVDKRTIRGGGIGVMPAQPGNVGVYIFDAKEQTVLLYNQPVKF